MYNVNKPPQHNAVHTRRSPTKARIIIVVIIQRQAIKQFDQDVDILLTIIHKILN